MIAVPGPFLSSGHTPGVGADMGRILREESEHATWTHHESGYVGDPFTGV